MIGKFAIFLVVAVCAIQGHARSYEAKDDIAHNLQGIEEVIQEIINKIKNIIAEISGKIPEIIKQIEDKINEILQGLNLDEIVEKIKKAIEAIIGSASEAVQACIEKQQDAILQLAQDEQKGAQACAEAAAAKVMDIKDRMEKLVAQAMTVEGEVQAKVEKCVQDNGSNVIGLVTCLKNEVLPYAGQVIQMEKDLAQLISDAQKVIPEAAEGLNTCMSKLAEDLQVREQAIVSDIKKCLIGQ